mgnify:CR=1 FL=1
MTPDPQPQDGDKTHPLLRRYSDERIDRLEERQVRIEERVGAIDGKMDEQTNILQNVSDVLGTFRVVAAVAKWLGIVIGAGAAVTSAVAAFFHMGGNGPR